MIKSEKRIDEINGADGAPERARLRDALAWIGLAGILAIAVMRCAISTAPQVAFDVDPVFDPTPFGGLGPAGSLMLDVLLLVAAACALAGETLRGRSLNWLAIACALAPAPVMFRHGLADLGDMRIGASWLSAIVAATALAHLARDRPMRLVILALLAAVGALLAVRGFVYVFHEHAALLDVFRTRGNDFLVARGIEPGSIAAADFERRLRQPQPTGWFVTTNVLASVLLACAIIGVGLALGPLLRDPRRAAPWVVLAAAAASLYLIVAGGSKGAIGAFGVGLVLLVPAFSGGLARRLGRWGGLVLPLVAAAGMMAIVARGTILSESFMNDRSLLFRWHYLEGASSMIATHPLSGVGPDGFQAEYASVRPARSPEEVTSAHSIFVDWLATLGVSTIGWIGLVVWWLVRAGRGHADDEDDLAIPSARALVPVLFVTIIGLGIAIRAEAHVLGPAEALARATGLIVFAGAAVALWTLLRERRTCGIAWTFAAAVGALLLHGQIEMTFAQPGAVAWGLCLLGTVATAGSRGAGSIVHRLVGGAATVVTLGLAVALWVSAVRPAQAQTALVLEAVDTLAPLSVPGLPRDDYIRRRLAAAELLQDAWETCPTTPAPLEAAARQIAAAGELHKGEPRVGLLIRAATVAEDAIGEHGRGSSLALAAELRTRIGDLNGDRWQRDRAIEWLTRLTELDPQGLRAWVRLGDLAFKASRPLRALEAYENALWVSDAMSLDPLKQLDEKERSRLESFVTMLSSQLRKAGE